MAVHQPRRRFTVDEYHQMAEAGILHEDDRIELIAGEIIEMSPIGHQHAGLVNRLTRLFLTKFGDAAVIGPQNPILLSDDTEPQPDLTVLRPRDDYYASALPGAEDVLLVVEVADTSVRYDRQVKVPLYGRLGILEAWLVDLNRQTVTIFRDPTATGYRTSREARRGEQLAPQAFPDVAIAVEDMLG